MYQPAESLPESDELASSAIPMQTPQLELVELLSDNDLVLTFADYENLLANAENDFGLSALELQALDVVSRGATTQEAAEKLHITEQTVKFHLNGVYSKLSLNNWNKRTEAVRIGCQNGLLPKLEFSEGSEPQPPTTNRQRQVLSGIAYGLNDGEIGGALNVVGATVQSHLKLLLNNLGAKNRVHAVRLAYSLGIDIEPLSEEGNFKKSVRRQPKAAKTKIKGNNSEDLQEPLVVIKVDNNRKLATPTEKWQEPFKEKATSALKHLGHIGLIDKSLSTPKQVFRIDNKELLTELHNDLLVPSDHLERGETDLYGVVSGILFNHKGVKTFLDDERTTGSARRIIGEAISEYLKKDG